MSGAPLTQILNRSNNLEAAVWTALPNPYRPVISSPRHDASLAAAMMAVEQGRACRLLFSHGMHTTGIAVTRMQFEAICRSMWLLYAAADDEISKATASLTAETAKAANDLPMASKMIEALHGKAPPMAIQMLVNFKEENLKTLHQFVHAGFHPLKRTLDGYPEELVVGVLRNCNGLCLTTGAMLAVLAGSQPAMGAIAKLQAKFADSLPSPAQPGSSPSL
jgi:hypothetical protein